MAIRMHLACDVCGRELLVASGDLLDGGARTSSEARRVGQLLGWVTSAGHICDTCTRDGWTATRTPDRLGRTLHRSSPST